MTVKAFIQTVDDYNAYVRTMHAKYLTERRFGDTSYPGNNRLLLLADMLDKIKVGNLRRGMGQAVALPCWLTEGSFNQLLSILKTTMR